MRIIIGLFFLLPFAANTQINRSAKELARETTKNYLVSKIFKGDSYKPIAYGELKAWNDTRSEISWTISHDFEVTKYNNSGFDKPGETHHIYTFLFYLDKKMQVLKAETYYLNLKQ